MVHVKSIVFIFTIVTLKNVLSFKEITTIADLDQETVDELKILLDMPYNSAGIASPKLKPSCKRIGEVKVNFLLYTRENPDIPISLEIDNPIEVQANKKTVMLVHGWLSDSNSSTTIELKNEYIKRYDCNVIVVDWSQISWQRYTTAFCTIPRISFHVTKFMCNLEDRLNGSIKELHAIGHSVGAQILGVVSHYVQNKCHQKIGRITGLDPAGPLFQDVVAWRRLDQNDAMFVDVIHTDEFHLGYKGNMGSIDFHVNCGQFQPGCPSVRSFDSDSSISTVMCSHLRSMEYMKISLTSQNFLAVSCGLCPRYCRPNLMSEIYVVMGEDCTEAPRNAKKFYLTTSSSYPYHNLQ